MFHMPELVTQNATTDKVIVQTIRKANLCVLFIVFTVTIYMDVHQLKQN